MKEAFKTIIAEKLNLLVLYINAPCKSKSTEFQTSTFSGRISYEF